MANLLMYGESAYGEKAYGKTSYSQYGILKISFDESTNSDLMNRELGKKIVILWIAFLVESWFDKAWFV